MNCFGRPPFGAIKSEIDTAKKLFSEHSWPVIDVTRRSIEETATAIYQLYRKARDAANAPAERDD